MICFVLQSNYWVQAIKSFNESLHEYTCRIDYDRALWKERVFLLNYGCKIPVGLT